MAFRVFAGRNVAPIEFLAFEGRLAVGRRQNDHESAPVPLLRLSQLLATALRYDPRQLFAKFEDYRIYGAATVMAFSFAGLFLWIADYLDRPAMAEQTVVLRALFPLAALPYIASTLMRGALPLTTGLWLFGLLAAQTIHAAIAQRLGTSPLWTAAGYQLFFLAPFLMTGWLSLRVNLLSVIAIAIWPLMLSRIGLATSLDDFSYCRFTGPLAALTFVGLIALCYLIRLNFDYQRELQHASTIDSMTGAVNRACFRQMIAQAIKLAQRYRSPFAVIALDIDYFKGVNDRWGHATGDRAICHVVDICRQVVRDVDFVGRLGGEEFAIILPETTSSGAANVAARIRGLLHGQPCLTDDNALIDLTCSFGIASFRLTDQTPDPLLRRADIALYQAKQRGRDRVVVSDDLVPV